MSELWPTWRLSWLESIFEFASANMQEKLWKGDAVGVQSSFDECICGYFDDLDLGKGYEAFVRDGMVSRQEADILLKFHDLADHYEPPNQVSDSAVFSDPQWAKVTAEAQRAWLSLKAVITSEKELARMGQLEAQWGSFSE